MKGRRCGNLGLGIGAFVYYRRVVENQKSRILDEIIKVITVDMPLVQEFMPSHKRGWVSVLTTTLLPAGNLLGGVAGWLLAPIIGWRGLFLIGLVPIVLVLMVRYWVPESPRWLIRMGRHEDARKSLAWALQVDPKQIE